MSNESNQDHSQAESAGSGKSKHSICCRPCGPGAGILLVLIGGYFLAREMGWLSVDIPIWPLAIIGVGLWMLIKRT